MARGYMAINLFGVAVMDNEISENSYTKFYRMPRLKSQLDVSQSSIWAWVKAGKFPKPIKLGANTTVWRAADVEAWAQSKIAASQKNDSRMNRKLSGNNKSCEVTHAKP